MSRSPSGSAVTVGFVEEERVEADGDGRQFCWGCGEGDPGELCVSMVHGEGGAWFHGQSASRSSRAKVCCTFVMEPTPEREPSVGDLERDCVVIGKARDEQVPLLSKVQHPLAYCSFTVRHELVGDELFQGRRCQERKVGVGLESMGEGRRRSESSRFSIRPSRTCSGIRG